MKLIKCLMLLGVISFVISCSTPEEKMTKYMLGNWKTAFYKWELPTYQGKDTLVEYAFDYTNPDESRPEGVTFYKYKEEGVFETWNEIKGGVKTKKTIGKWRVTKDSLFYDFDSNNKVFTISMKLEKIEDGYATNRTVDQDRDGKIDDTLYLETVRLPDDLKE
jgi:hypothetical protein